MLEPIMQTSTFDHFNPFPAIGWTVAFVEIVHDQDDKDFSWNEWYVIHYECSAAQQHEAGMVAQVVVNREWFDQYCSDYDCSHSPFHHVFQFANKVRREKVMDDRLLNGFDATLLV
jgi:hypothetical protein